jgi:hypothetical protein
VSPYWLNLIDIELLDLLHMFLDVICKSIYGNSSSCPRAECSLSPELC